MGFTASGEPRHPMTSALQAATACRRRRRPSLGPYPGLDGLHSIGGQVNSQEPSAPASPTRGGRTVQCVGRACSIGGERRAHPGHRDHALRCAALGSPCGLRKEGRLPPWRIPRTSGGSRTRLVRGSGSGSRFPGQQAGCRVGTRSPAVRKDGVETGEATSPSRTGAAPGVQGLHKSPKRVSCAACGGRGEGNQGLDFLERWFDMEGRPASSQLPSSILDWRQRNTTAQFQTNGRESLAASSRNNAPYPDTRSCQLRDLGPKPTATAILHCRSR